jgi:hypothetical protein
MRALLCLERDSARAIEKATAVLFSAIPLIVNVKDRGAVLRVRRSLFNSRMPPTRDIAVVVAALPRDAAAAVQTAITTLSQIAKAESQLASSYHSAIAEARGRIKAFIRNSRFQDGLLLSSSSLSANLARYTSTADGQLGSRDLQIERGLLRYLTRASMKATPFSSFCTIVEGYFAPPVLSEDSGLVFQSRGSLTPRRNLVRMNKMLYGSLWTVLKNEPFVRDKLIVRLNATIMDDGSQFRFMAAVARKEVFQRLRKTEAIQVITDALSISRLCCYGDLCRGIAADGRVECTPTEARTFVDELVRMGFLRLESPVRAQDLEWASTLADALERTSDDAGCVLADALRECQSIAAAYAEESSMRRAVLGDRLNKNVERVLGIVGMDTSKPLQPLYEDCGADVRLEVQYTSDVKAALGSLRSLIDLLAPHANPRPAMAAMRHFFDSYYGEGTVSVPLLSFYEDYYREHFRSHLDKEARIRSGLGGSDDLRAYSVANPFNLPVVDAMTDAAASWRSAVRNIWAAMPDAVEIHITAGDIPVPVGLPAVSLAHRRSVAVFCQFVAADNTDDSCVRLVTNGAQLHLGFGKYFSRFLPLFGPAFQESLKARAPGATKYRLAEIGGDANFNANLHPRMLPWEIVYPTGDSEQHAGSILCTDITVARDPDDRLALVLRDEVNAAVVQPVDLGFLSSMMRPPLYQLLTQFTRGGGSVITLPESLGSTKAGDRSMDSVQYRPRIVFDKRVVLARRRWTIRSPAFPYPEAHESGSEYFVRLNKWRDKHNIPRQVYARIFRQRSVSKAENSLARDDESDVFTRQTVVDNDPADHQTDECVKPVTPATDRIARGQPREEKGRANERNVSRDFIKPQFIDFESPHMVELFARLPAHLSSFSLVLEERYPDAGSLPLVEGRRYVTEMIIQLDWPSSEEIDVNGLLAT